MTKEVYIVIVAGGKGKRMGIDIPKQFLLLNKQPVLMHTIQQFFSYNPQHKIIVVLPHHQIKYWKELVQKHHFSVPHTIVEGGEERFFSVKNALQNITDGYVLIHDGVRPLVTHNTIAHVLQTLEEKGNAVPMLPIEDSLRQITDKGTQSVDRNYFRAVQTPQGFVSQEIKEAYGQEFSKAFTDDASVYEAWGGIIHETIGNKENIRITTQEDILLTNYYIKSILQ